MKRFNAAPSIYLKTPLPIPLFKLRIQNSIRMSTSSFLTTSDNLRKFFEFERISFGLKFQNPLHRFLPSHISSTTKYVPKRTIMPKLKSGCPNPAKSRSQRLHRPYRYQQDDPRCILCPFSGCGVVNPSIPHISHCPYRCYDPMQSAQEMNQFHTFTQHRDNESGF